ncbi:MAG: DegV family protein [Oscillibacter sp.]|nr:DegV family protein [Oscillibacter sp.]
MTPKKIAVLTDSCVDLSPDVLRQHHIYTVPLRILCADGEYLDGLDIRSADVYRRLRAGELPKTSLPSTESLEQTLRQILSDGFDGIIGIMVSSGISGTYNLVRLAAEELEADNDGVAMRVYDTLSGSVGEGMIVLQILKDLENGCDWQELTERRIPFLIRNTTVAFSVDTLEYLLKGGRIGKVAAAAGTLLQIKPLLAFSPDDGQLQSVAKARGRNQVLSKLVDLMAKYHREGRRYNLAVANGGDPAGMELLREKLTAALPDYGFLCEGEINGTFSVYIGDGILGAGIQLLD